MQPKTIQQALYNFFKEKPIAYHPRLSIALGSVKAGLFMAQSLHWCGKGNDPVWFYKTVEEFKMETGLSRKEQENAIKLCKQKGVLETKLKQIPAKRHFRINLKLLKELCLSSSQTYEVPSNIEANSISPESPRNTETTTEINTNINKLIKLKQLKREVLANSSLTRSNI